MNKYPKKNRTEAVIRAEKAYNARRREEMQEEGCKVYYLPEEHYVGVTWDVPNRVRMHRNAGSNIEGWRVLSCHATRIEARHKENLWHSWLGCNGINGDH